MESYTHSYRGRHVFRRPLISSLFTKIIVVGFLIGSMTSLGSWLSLHYWAWVSSCGVGLKSDQTAHYYPCNIHAPISPIATSSLQDSHLRKIVDHFSPSADYTAPSVLGKLDSREEASRLFLWFLWWVVFLGIVMWITIRTEICYSKLFQISNFPLRNQ